MAHQAFLQSPHVSSADVLVLERQLHQVQRYILTDKKQTLCPSDGRGAAERSEPTYLRVDDVNDDILVCTQLEGLCDSLVHTDRLCVTTTCPSAVRQSYHITHVHKHTAPASMKADIRAKGALQVHFHLQCCF